MTSTTNIQATPMMMVTVVATHLITLVLFTVCLEAILFYLTSFLGDIVPTDSVLAYYLVTSDYH